ncbi:Transcriptional regulator, MarR family [Deinococcus marmoris]|uniref:Transcriptional regulator, MarR family n=1 Tax=Deinococcus marmoris TaxID=249408 RepID=A0A1U7NT09_9DEIO|nr:Transcriptional regulator, MarR family [Deinococcus marmoris]
MGRFMGALWRFGRSFRQELDALLVAQGELDSPRFNVLQGIRSGHSYPKALAAALHMPPTLLSRYLDQLCKQNLIERQIDAVDSRRIHLTLTPAGEQLTATVIQSFLLLAAERLTDINPKQLEGLTTLLEQLDAPKTSQPSQENA